MDELTLDEVALHAGVSRAEIDEFVSAGILDPDRTGRLQDPDIARARLVNSLRRAGVSLDDMSKAIRQDRISLDYVELLMPDPVRLIPAPVSGDQAGWLEYEPIVASLLGTARATDEPIRQDDLAILGVVAAAVDLGAPLDRVIRIIRALALAAAKVTDLQREFVDEVLLGPAIERTGSPVQALEETSATRLRYRELGIDASALLTARFVDDAIFANLVQLTELALSAAGLEAAERLQTVVFVDVSDYTRLSEEKGDEASARQAALLTQTAQRLALKHGGRLVKSLGDGAMLHFTDPGRGLSMAIDAVAGAEELGLWPLHAGVSSGPMVRRDGDYFGATVNLASRLAGEAGPGEVLVSGEVVSLLEDTEYRFTPLGERSLKNVSQPVAVYLTDRVEPAGEASIGVT